MWYLEYYYAPSRARFGIAEHGVREFRLRGKKSPADYERAKKSALALYKKHFLREAWPHDISDACLVWREELPELDL